MSALVGLGGYGSSSEEAEAASQGGGASPPPSPAAEAPAEERRGPSGPSLGPSLPAGDSFEALPEVETLPEAADWEEEEEATTACGCAPAALLRAARLPPPPSARARPELEAKLRRFHGLLAAGHAPLNEQLKARKDYRNPDFLQRAVDHFGVSEYATALPPAVFDPSALASEDFYDALGAFCVCAAALGGPDARGAAAAQRQQAETKEAERRSRANIEFATAHGGVAPGGERWGEREASVAAARAAAVAAQLSASIASRGGERR